MKRKLLLTLLALGITLIAATSFSFADSDSNGYKSVFISPQSEATFYAGQDIKVVLQLPTYSARFNQVSLNVCKNLFTSVHEELISFPSADPVTTTINLSEPGRYTLYGTVGRFFGGYQTEVETQGTYMRTINVVEVPPAMQPGAQSRTAKLKQPMIVAAATKSVKAKKLKKKARIVAPLSVTKSQGPVTFKVAGGNVKSKKALKVDPFTGKVTVKKKTKKGTYKVQVLVTARGNNSFESGSSIVWVTVKVK